MAVVNSCPPKEVCTVSDTFDQDNLDNTTCDPCLENNPFGQPIPLDAVIPIGDEREFAPNHVTWYANGFQWRIAKNGEVFNAYEYTVAIGDDLKKEYPVNSLVGITYNGRSIIARVTDRKPFDGMAESGLKDSSVDLSKAVAYELGGYELLTSGVVKPVQMQRVIINYDSRYFEYNPSYVLPDNHITIAKRFLKTHENGKKGPVNPPPTAYKDLIAIYSRVASTVGAIKLLGLTSPDMSRELTPRLSFIVTTENRPSRMNPKIYDTYHFLELQLLYIPDEDLSVWAKKLSDILPKDSTLFIW